MSEEELHAQRVEIAELTRELEETNRGLIALYTELARAKEAEARLAAIVQSSDDAMFSMTPDGVVDSWNPGAEWLLGYTAAEALGQRVEELVSEEARGQLAAAQARLRTGERVEPYDTWQRCRDGSLVQVAATLSAMRDPEGQLIGISAVLRDQTERTRAEAALAAARTDQEVMADRERIARDLHDLVIQRIFGAGLALHGAVSLGPGPEVSDRLETVIRELDATVSEIRTTIFALQQTPQDAMTVRSQVHQAVSDAARTLGFQPSLRFEGPIEAAVPDGIREHLLAVVREALSNVTRHARASAVEVTLSVGEHLVLQVADNGCGLGRVTGRSGLRNLQERAAAYGGSSTVGNRAGGGTELAWWIPLRS
jgi:PAS domain S-box-containing protein